MTSSETLAIDMDSSLSLPIMEKEEVISEASSSLSSSTETEIIDLDPSTLATQANSLLASLEEVTTALSHLRNHDSAAPPADPKPPSYLDSIVGSGISHCHGLYTSYAELEQVLLTYSKVWDPDNPLVEEDPPYGRELEHCIRNAALKAVELRGSIGEIETTNHDASSTALQAFEVEIADMGKEAQRISEFLPILKADQAEYLRTTGLMEDSRSRYANTYDAFGPPSFPWGKERLRQKLYDLKDAMRVSNEALSKIISEMGASEQQNDLKKLEQQQCRLVEAITEALTNHDSEWIESMLAGRLTYAEFLRIDLTTVEESIGVWMRFTKSLRSEALQVANASNSLKAEKMGDDLYENWRPTTLFSLKKREIAEVRDSINALNKLFKIGETSSL